jgi:DNA-binding transcriptional MerR regulator
MPAASLPVGALARRTGLTVRTLHHYEAVGLLVPSERTAAGHRRYTAADLARLQQVVSLRALGLPLDEIRAALDERPDPAGVVEKHLERVRQQGEAARRLEEKLDALARLLRAGQAASTDDLLHILHLTTMIEQQYTPEQLAYLERRRAEVGEARIREVEAEWPQLMAEVRAEMERGTPPADPRVGALARRWRGLVAEFTGGDPGVGQSLGRLYQERGDDMAAMNGQDPAAFRALFAYVGEAQKALDAEG